MSRKAKTHGAQARLLLGCLLVRVATDAYDIKRDGWPLGMICKSKKSGKWAATWNMIPEEGDNAYKYESDAAAVQQLIDWETKAKETKR